MLVRNRVILQGKRDGLFPATARMGWPAHGSLFFPLTEMPVTEIAERFQNGGGSASDQLPGGFVNCQFHGLAGFIDWLRRGSRQASEVGQILFNGGPATLVFKQAGVVKRCTAEAVKFGAAALGALD